jgi:hypothetical protein
MRRSGFRKQSFQEIKEKQAVKLARNIASKRVKINSKPLKTKKVPKKRTNLPKLSTMRNKCDALLTPIIKKMYPYCIFTGQETQVAHHAIKKSSSSALRYYLPNLIPLTHIAHSRLHHDEITWTGRLIELKGMEWWQDLERERKRDMKIDIHYYIETHKQLTDILNKL